jgi:hypothetical protein
MKPPSERIWIFIVLIAGWFYAGSACAGLKPFPLTAGQQGTVTCLEHPSISYSVYLPPAYSTNGPPLPVLYTLNPNVNNGGLVSDFESIDDTLKIITVGIISSSNTAQMDVVLRDFYAVPHDLRQRVLFDPSAEFVAGFSGGGENAYIFSRFWAQHIAGIFAMSGWMGCTYAYSTNGQPVYYSTSEVLTNTLVARTTGSSDDATQTTFKGPDGTFLTNCGAIVKDWTFSGGHEIPPSANLTTALQWLLSSRTLPGAGDQTNAQAQANNWRSLIAAGQSQTVLQQCVNTLLNQPRTWYALEAQLVMDDLMTNYSTFRTLNVSNLAQGHFASDLFFYAALGAATNHDWPHYDGNLKALGGVTGTGGERAGDIYYVLNKFQYPGPWLQIALDPVPGQIDVWLLEDAPGLSYMLQSCDDLVNDPWVFSPMEEETDTNAIWSASRSAIDDFSLDPNSASVFLNVETTPVPGTSPPWPNGSYGP